MDDGAQTICRRELLPFGTLRVRLLFAGVEVREHEKNPQELIGRVFPWDSLGPFGTFTRLIDAQWSPVRSAGRRWFVKIDDRRQTRVARRLRTRWIKNQLRNGETVREYAPPETIARWIMWMCSTVMAAMIVAFVAPAFGGTLKWLQSQPLSMRIVAGLTLAGTLLLYALMVLVGYYFGWKAGLPVARRIIYDGAGFAAEMSTGALRHVEWTAVRSVRRDWSAYQLDVAGQDPVRLPATVVTGNVLGAMKVRTQQREVCAEAATQTDVIRNGLSRHLLWRVTMWSFLGGIAAAFAQWWVSSQGLAPRPFTPLVALGTIASVMAIAGYAWLLWLLPAKRCDQWLHRLRRRRANRQRSPMT